ncbi:MAG: peptidase M16 [Deltaproteobacteria bacterium]|nr:peptidase M16 [Deltaproteobacteria bacterium]
MRTVTQRTRQQPLRITCHNSTYRSPRRPFWKHYKLNVSWSLWMKIECPHGLTLLIEPSHAAPVVAIQAWVGVGSADETESEAGLAHFHEHMLFKGTEKRGVGEIAKDVEGVGGHINAWTSYDETVYHLTLPSAHWETGVEILADVLQHSSFAAEEIEKEAEVILEEIKRAEDQPSQQLSQKTFSLAFETHPYKNPIIGTRETVAGFTRDDLLRFYKKWYTPDNITLVIVGDIDPEAVQAKVLPLFEGNQNAKTQRHRTQEGPQTDLRLGHIVEDTQESLLHIAYPIPALHHPDLYALEMLSVLLGQLESSRLDMVVRRQKQLVNSVFCYAYTPRDQGLFMLGGSMPPGHERQALAALLEELEHIQHTPPSRQEVEKARMIIKSDAIYNKETVQGRARALGFYEVVAEDLSFEERFYYHIERVKPRDIQRVAQQYLQLAHANIVFLTPSQQPKEERLRITEDDIRTIHKQLQDAIPPQAEEDTHQPYQTTLSNGIRVILKENTHASLVSIRTAMYGGLRYETPENNGINHMISRLLTKGTASMDAETFSLVTDEMAATIGGYSGRNSLGLSGDFLSQYLDEGLALLADCHLNPLFDEEELERERYFVLEEIRAQEAQISDVVFRLFQEAIFAQHPYRMPMQGTPESVKSLTPASLKAFYDQLCAPEGLVISVVGDFEREHLLTQLEEHFGNMPSRTLTPPTLPEETPTKTPKTVTSVKDRMQSHIIYGFLGTTMYDKDRYVFEVLNALLSGQGGRLFIHLRDEVPLAYSVSSFSLELIERGYFAVHIGTSPHKQQQAIDAIHTQLARLQDEPIPTEELARIKRFLIGSHAISRQRNASQAFAFVLHELYGQGLDAIEQYPTYISEVTAQDIQRVAKQYFDLQNPTIAIVHPPEDTTSKEHTDEPEHQE